MNKSLKHSVTDKWVLVLDEYERLKEKRSKNFQTVTHLCEVFKVNRKDIRRYYERWIISGKNRDALIPHKRGRNPGKYKILSKDEERVIMKIRRRFNANKHEISHLIQGYFKIHPSVSTIYRTFKRYPLNTKRKQAIKRYEKSYPGELAHSDTYRIDPTVFVERNKYHLFGIIDDCTRLCYVELIEKNNSGQTSQAFGRAYKWFREHGFSIGKLMTDNGSEYTAYTAKSKDSKNNHCFENTLTMFNVKHSYTRPYHPQTNGKIERFWRIVHDELIKVQRKTLTKQEFIAELNGFMYRYNYQRRHGSLDYKTPLGRLKFIADLLPNM